jgi:hypothetical protein
MLKDLLKARWACDQRKLLAMLLQARIEFIVAGCAGEGDVRSVGFLGRVSALKDGLCCDKVADLLRKPGLSLHAKQVLLVAVWGVLPCGA